MTDLTAIDILIDPDEQAIERARDDQRSVAQERAAGMGTGRHPPAAHHDAPALRAHRGPRPGLRRRRKDGR